MSQYEWDSRFLAHAQLVGSWSKDPSTKVGAVIADSMNRAVSSGYNGFPRGVIDLDRRLNDREIRLKMTIHAEENAILFARRDLANCTIYSTFFPCARCACKIIQTGIRRVVSISPPAEFAKRWHGDIELAKIMFEEAGMIVTMYDEFKHVATPGTEPSRG